MKLRTLALLVVAVVAFSVAPAWGQLGGVKGKALDENGAPIVDATVEMRHRDTGRRAVLKTDKNGEFFSIGLSHGIYHARLLKDGKELSTMEIPVRVGAETSVIFELPKERERVITDASEITEEQRKQLTEEQRKQLQALEQEQVTVKNLNQLLAQAAEAQQAGNLQEAISLLQRAVELDSTRDLLWVRLADLRLAAGRFEPAVEAYQRAIAIKPAGVYYNNMGQALLKAGRNDDAVQAYTKAAEIDPPNAATYFFNLGAGLTNINQPDQANEAFDKALAADPKHADAYYEKGVNLLGKATVQGDKMVAPPGTAEAFNKYLELQPNGRFAETAKQLLESIGAKVETQVGRPRRR